MRGSKILIVEEEFQTYSLNQINSNFECLLKLPSVFYYRDFEDFFLYINLMLNRKWRAVPCRALSVPENLRPA